jgi:hypothetical protein
LVADPRSFLERQKHGINEGHRDTQLLSPITSYLNCGRLPEPLCFDYRVNHALPRRKSCDKAYRDRRSSGLQDFQLEGRAKGSLSSVAVDSPARGKVFAKTGTNVGFDSLGQHLLVQSKALAGFFQQADGEWQVFNVVVNDAGGAPDITAALSVNVDVGEVAAQLWKEANPAGR